MDTSPYQPPTTEPQTPLNRMQPTGTPLLTLYFASAFAVVSIGNHFVVFWGTNGFQFWQLGHYLPRSLFFEGILLMLALVLAPLAAARFPESSFVDRTRFAGMVIYPALLITLAFGILRFRGLPDEKLLILLSASLVVLQVFAVAYHCRRMMGGWRLTAALTFVCGTAGVTAGVIHIVSNSLVT